MPLPPPVVRKNVEAFLEALRGADASQEEGLDPDDTARNIITEIFTTGNCGNLAVMLVTAFGGRIFNVGLHYVAEIAGRLYDITGDVTEKYGGPQHSVPVDEVMNPHTGMYNNYSFALRGPMV